MLEEDVPAAPEKLAPDFARERTKKVWAEFESSLPELVPKLVRRHPGKPTLRAGRVLKAGDGVVRYQTSLLGGKNEPLRAKTPARVHPSDFLKAKLGAERYRRFFQGAKKGDPYPGKRGK